MAIGNGVNVTETSANATLGQLAINLRNDAASIINWFGTVNALGVAGLVALGFTANDAANYFTACNELQTIAQVYYGTAAQTPAFNFDNALAPVRAGA